MILVIGSFLNAPNTETLKIAGYALSKELGDIMIKLIIIDTECFTDEEEIKLLINLQDFAHRQLADTKIMQVALIKNKNEVKQNNENRRFWIKPSI